MGGVVSGGELPGVDLARVALETTKKNRGNTRTTKAKPRTTSVVRRDGREPMGLAIGARVTERAPRRSPARVRAGERRPTGPRCSC
ncbi:hypothetical protein [Streptomyces sp. NBC_00989]|uniref:hypothetical protein n=1 Tax=Streptomyces sp. NBC_00989 TaxID=2903705 RepID=UPI00386FCCB7